MNRLCSICARGGSKGVRNKNLMEMHGKPLIAHTILQAKDSKLFDCIVVSSDSPEILAIAERFGVSFTIDRPKELATDAAPKLPAIRHAAAEAEKLCQKSFDVFCDLDATSPLRSIEDIKGAIQLLESTMTGNVITGYKSRRSPYFNMVELDQNGYVSLCKEAAQKFARRQDVPTTYDMNASIYVWTRKSLFSQDGVINDTTKLFEMPEWRSIDIDSEFDAEFVSYLMAQAMSRETKDADRGKGK